MEGHMTIAVSECICQPLKYLWFQHSVMGEGETTGNNVTANLVGQRHMTYNVNVPFKFVHSFIMETFDCSLVSFVFFLFVLFLACYDGTSRQKQL